jgi:hypothetical protein
MRSKGLPRLQKRLESREDPRPPVGILKKCGIAVGKLVVRDHDLYRLLSWVSVTFTLDATAPSPTPNLYSSNVGASTRTISPVT